MREILFRGQTHRKGEKVNMANKPLPSRWVYGGIFHTPNDFSIIYGYDPIEKYSVYSETVGQYTGLTDRNGVKIFEGDIIRHYRAPHFYETGEVRFDGETCSFVRTGGKNGGICRISGDGMYEVIGNIYDDPELLGGDSK